MIVLIYSAVVNIGLGGFGGSTSRWRCKRIKALAGVCVFIDQKKEGGGADHIPGQEEMNRMNVPSNVM